MQTSARNALRRCDRHSNSQKHKKSKRANTNNSWEEFAIFPLLSPPTPLFSSSAYATTSLLLTWFIYFSSMHHLMGLASSPTILAKASSMSFHEQIQLSPMTRCQPGTSQEQDRSKKKHNPKNPKFFFLVINIFFLRLFNAESVSAYESTTLVVVPILT